MKKNKKYFLIGGLVLVLIVLILCLLMYLNSRKNGYSFSEKSFINSNLNNVIDVSVEGSLPIFSNSGVGVFYDFVNFMERDTKLTFNVQVNGSGTYKFTNKNELGGNDLLFYTDHFVVVSTLSDEIVDLNTLSGKNVAVMDTDKDYVSKYMSEYNVNIVSFSHFNDLTDQMSDSVLYAILPMQKYINSIVYNKYNIVYHIDGLHSHYVLSMNDASSTMSKIFTKAFNMWKSEILPSINSHFLELYYDAYNLTEVEKERVTSDDLIVGYVDNMPFEGKLNRNFSGITSMYLDIFSDMTGATYKYIEYKNINKLIEALNNKKVDLAVNYYDVNSSNYVDSVSLGTIKYVILAHQSNKDSFDNLVSISDDNIKMVGNTKLYKYISGINSNINTYKDYKKMFKSLTKEDILVIEKSTYDYYKNSSLKKYVIKYMGESTVSNTFLLNNDNKVLNNLFNFYLSTTSNNNIESMAIDNSLNMASRNILIEFIISNITYLVLLVIAVVFLLYKFNRKVKVTKKIKKEDKMMYLDVMTNLKNRNYLNDNLSYWEDNKVYPQAVVVIDLNNISIINDTKGHEEGDRQIKSAASILIKTQRENSEIIRTDGNEFLIYLVGYEENQIVTYVNKLMKEFKSLPYEYGASMGYFMITSESTTIDDAINEALIKMRENKGE
jgi:diguanylate cyclase and metal dependent phosphohydrolase